MFLPVLLVRDYGIAGFLVFAIPNVIGAAAMGKILPDAQSSRRFVHRHRAACAAFSAVTILFHVFFVAWIIQSLIGPIAFAITAVSLAILLVIFASEQWTIVTSWLVLCASLIAFAFVRWRVPWAMQQVHLLGNAPATNLLGLAPVCVVGFFLDPYLDLTFHRARQATSPRGGEVAFAVGFGGCFASMILFTLWYAHLLGRSELHVLPGPIAWVIALHMSVQSAFTIAAHARSLAMEWSPATCLGTVLGAAAEVSVVICCLLVVGGTSSETMYRALMGFYGLVFPAYLWICPRGTSRRGLTTCAVAVAAAAPLFWLGFIESRMLWLIPGIAIVLIARLLTSADPPPNAQTAAPSSSPHAASTHAP